MSGRLIMSKEGKAQSGEAIVSHQLFSGNYLLVYKSADGLSLQRIIAIQ